MTAAFTCITINDLPEYAFIGGTEQIFSLLVYNDVGLPVALTGATCTWKMSYYGMSSAALTKTGVVSGSVINQYDVKLLASDTSGSFGKFVHQPVIVISGSTIRPSQGILTIIPGII